jgi:RimJ/RimL family protein N-acetyltransferase
MSLSEQRRYIRSLLDDTDPKDAPTAYYALFHDPKRSTLATAIDDRGIPEGFVGIFQTGQDLFRPLVTMMCRNAEVAATLLAESLTPGRAYIFFANLNQLLLAGDSLQVENQQILQIYRLEVARFKPQVNVTVVHSRGPNNTPRCEVSAGGLRAVAGVNWQSPGFAEVYVHTDPEAQERGWGRRVLTALTDQILREGRQPIYLVETRNDPSRALAESVGYVDTGYRQVHADMVYPVKSLD